MDRRVPPGHTVGLTPGQISLKAAGNINLASVSTENYQRIDEKYKDKAWQETHGEGSYDQQTHYSQLTAGQLDLQAANRITADMGVRDSAAVLAKEPGMGWLKQLQQDPAINQKVDWKSIEEAHQKWDYKQQGLTPAAAAVVAVVVAYFTAGAGTSIVNAAASSTTAAATSTGAVAASMIQAAVSTMASQAAVATINNGGRLDETLKTLSSSANMRQLATAVVTAGVLNEIGGIQFGEGKNAFRLKDVTVKNGLTANIGKNLVDGLARATLTSAITGTDLQTNIRTEVVNSVLNAAAAQGAKWIGDVNAKDKLNIFAHTFAHAVAGCMAGAAGASASGSGISGGKACGAGAIGAAVGELSAQLYNSGNGDAPAKKDTVAFASMMGSFAAALTGQNAQGVAIASGTAANAAQNNHLKHAQIEALGSAWAQCQTQECKQQLIGKYRALSTQNDKALAACTTYACVASKLTEINQANTALAASYRIDPKLYDVVNGWQAYSQTQLAPATAYRNNLVTNRKQAQLLQTNSASCRGLSASACVARRQEGKAYAAFAGFTTLGIMSGGLGDIAFGGRIVDSALSRTEAASSFNTATDGATGNIVRGEGSAGSVSNVAKGAASKLDDALAKYKKNDIHHLFGRGGEVPTKLLDKFGSPQAALKELQKSAQSIANKSYETGSWVTVKVGDIPVSIQGKVIDGIFRISSIAKREF